MLLYNVGADDLTFFPILAFYKNIRQNGLDQPEGIRIFKNRGAGVSMNILSRLGQSRGGWWSLPAMFHVIHDGET